MQWIAGIDTVILKASRNLRCDGAMDHEHNEIPCLSDGTIHQGSLYTSYFHGQSKHHLQCAESIGLTRRIEDTQ